MAIISGMPTQGDGSVVSVVHVVEPPRFAGGVSTFVYKPGGYSLIADGVLLVGNDFLDYVDVSGDSLTQTDVGNFTTVLKLRETNGAAKWGGDRDNADGIELNWTVEKAEIPKVPVADKSAPYTGTTIYVNGDPNETNFDVWDSWDPEQLEIGGQYSGKDGGSYDATFKPTKNYKWAASVSETEDVELPSTWRIVSVGVATPKTGNEMEYDGSRKEPVWVSTDEDYPYNGEVSFQIEGDLYGVDAGEYETRFTPKGSCQWYDVDGVTEEPQATRVVKWEIKRQPSAAKPEQSNTLTVASGMTYRLETDVEWSGYDASKMEMVIGANTTTEAPTAGRFPITFRLLGNYAWTDGGEEDWETEWSVERITIPVPGVEESGYPVYNGSSQKPSFENYNSRDRILRVSYSPSATVDIGEYEATFQFFNETVASMYQWDGESEEDSQKSRQERTRTVSWRIVSASVSIDRLPEAENEDELKENGEEVQKVKWRNYEPEKLEIVNEAGHESVTETTTAGTYTTWFRPKDGYVWGDGEYAGTAAIRAFTWTVQEPDPIPPEERTRLSYPRQRNVPTYSGETYFLEGSGKKVEWENYNPSILHINLSKSDVSKSDAGTWKVTFSIIEPDKYVWDEDGTTDDYEGSWKISQRFVSTANRPFQNKDIYYDGAKHSIQNDDSFWRPQGILSMLKAESVNEGTTDGLVESAVGTYTVHFVPASENYTLGGIDYLESTWEIKKGRITLEPSQRGVLSYNGTEQSPIWTDYPQTNANTGESLFEIVDSYTDPSGEVRANSAEGTDVGAYWLVVKPSENYTWRNETTGARAYPWYIIEGLVEDIPASAGPFEYEGEAKDVANAESWTGYDPDVLEIRGITESDEQGWHEVEFRPKAGYKWRYPDDSVEDRSERQTNWRKASWLLGEVPRAAVDIPEPTQDTFTYDGSSHTPTLPEYDPDVVEVDVRPHTEAGTWTVTFRLKDTEHYKWNTETENDTSEKEYTWTIEKAPVDDVPTQDGTLKYTGRPQRPDWSYDWTSMLDMVDGQERGTDAKTYDVKFKPDSNHKWATGAEDDERPSSWAIGRKSGIKVPTAAVTELTYSKEEQTLVLANPDAAYINLYDVKKTDAGKYTARFELKDKSSTEWENNLGVDDQTLEWEIKPFGITKFPTSTGPYGFLDGYVRVADWKDYDPEQLELTGETQGTEERKYEVYFQPRANYVWADGGGHDGTDDIRKTEWEITEKTIIEIPTATNLTFVYNGTDSFFPTLDIKDRTRVNISGVTTAKTNASEPGYYETVFTLSDPSVQQWDWSKIGNYDTDSWSYTDDKSAITLRWMVERAPVSFVPTQHPEIVYDGKQHSPTWSDGTESRSLLNVQLTPMTETVSQIKAGVYSDSTGYGFAPTSNYKWPSGSDPYSARTFQWEIKQATLVRPVMVGEYEFTYDGDDHGPTLSGFDENTMVRQGSYLEHDANDEVYVMYVALKDTESARWSPDYGTDPVRFEWRISRKRIASGVPHADDITYDATEHGPVWIGRVDGELEVESWDGPQTNAGTYHATFVPTSNYCWEDDTTTGRDATWRILVKNDLQRSFATGDFTYDGTEKSAEIFNAGTYLLNRFISIGGERTGNEAGDYTVTFSLINPEGITNVTWNDGKTDNIESTWTIRRAEVQLPDYEDDGYIYDGTVKIPSILKNFDTNTVTVSGTDHETEAGTYHVTYSLVNPNSSYWIDESFEPVTIEWTIRKRPIPLVPSSATPLAYTGSERTPAWNNYPTGSEYGSETKPSQGIMTYPLKMEGQTSGKQAGTYTANFTPTYNWCWADGSTGTKEVEWEITALSGVEVPSVTGAYEWADGVTRRPVISSYDSSLIRVGGTLETDMTGVFEVSFELVDPSSSHWAGTPNDSGIKYRYWSVDVAEAALPKVISEDTVYDGKPHAPAMSSYNPKIVSRSGDASATDAGDYAVTFELKSMSYCRWEDGTVGAKVFPWSIGRGTIQPDPQQAGELVYDGSPKAPSWNISYGANWYSIDGTMSATATSATAAGTYNVMFTPTYNAKWLDGSHNARWVGWRILPADPVPKPQVIGSFPFDGSTQRPAILNFNPAIMKADGYTEALNAGKYSVTFELLHPGSVDWEGGGSDPVTCEWEIAKVSVDKPTATMTQFTYNGSHQGPDVQYSRTMLKREGAPTAANAGSYEATYSLLYPDSTYWSGEAETSAGPVSISWSIAKAKVDKVPEPAGTLAYTGTPRTAQWLGYDPKKLSVTGNVATDEGEHIATFTPTANYTWEDGSTTGRAATWKIEKMEVTTDPETGEELPVPIVYGNGLYEVPSAGGEFDFNGRLHRISISGYDRAKMTMTGQTEATKAGTYTVTFYLLDTANDSWVTEDGTKDTEPKSFTWTINPIVLPKPTLEKDTYTYSRETYSPLEQQYDSAVVETVGTASAYMAGEYRFRLSLVDPDSSSWDDEGHEKDSHQFDWTIDRAEIDAIPSPTADPIIFNGKEQTPTWNRYNWQWRTYWEKGILRREKDYYLDIAGDQKGTAAGTYTVTFTPTTNYRWSDELGGDADPRTVTWVIGKLENIAPPSVSGSYDFDGTEKKAVVGATDSLIIKVSGDTQATKAGTYTVLFDFVDPSSCTWSDETNGQKSGTWEVKPIEVDPVSVSGSLSFTYNGFAQGPNVAGHDQHILKRGGSVTAVNAGDYSITFEFVDPSSCTWKDTKDSKERTTDWKIARAKVSAVPAQSGTLAYNGAAQRPSWGGYLTSQLQIGGSYCGTEADTYTATFTPTANYMWWDETTDAKDATWTINPDGFPIPSVSPLEFTYNGEPQGPGCTGFLSSVMEADNDNKYGPFVEAGEYKITYRLKDAESSHWSTGGNDVQEFTWKILPAVFEPPKIDEGHFVYDGSTFSPENSGILDKVMDVTGDGLSGVNAGEYNVHITLKHPSSASWSDGSAAASSKDYKWYIRRSVLLAPPTADRSLTYNGLDQIQTWDGLVDSQLTRSGTLHAIPAGTYTATFTPTANYMWSEKIEGVEDVTGPINVDWTIAKKTGIVPPQVSGSFQYDGSNHSPTISTFDSNIIAASGDTASQRKANTYTVTFSLKDESSAEWDDQTTAPKSSTWTISPSKFKVPSVTDTSFTYDGVDHFPLVSAHNETAIKYKGAGASKQRNAGAYTLTLYFLDEDSATWDDDEGGSGERSFTWNIAKAKIESAELPFPQKQLEYNGQTQTQPWSGSVDKFTKSGDLSARNAGTYTAVFTPTSNYELASGDESYSRTWTVSTKIVEVPVVTGTDFTYDGNPHAPSSTDRDLATKTGGESKIPAGDYNVQYVLVV